LLNILC